MSQTRGLGLLLVVLLGSFGLVLALGGTFATSADPVPAPTTAPSTAPPTAANDAVSAATVSIIPAKLADGKPHQLLGGVRVWVDRADAQRTVCVTSSAPDWALTGPGWSRPSTRDGELVACRPVDPVAASLTIALVRR
jgi:hypothetical protein